MATSGYMLLNSAFAQVPTPFYAAVPGINMKTPGDTTLFTVPAGFKAFVQDIILECTASVATSVLPEIIVTTTGAGGVIYDENDVLAGPSQVGGLISLRDSAVAQGGQNPNGFAPASSAIKFTIINGATATTLTCTAHILGFVIPT